MTYRMGLIVEIAVELGYQIALISLFQVIYGNVHEIAGWTYWEVLFMTGLVIIANEINLGVFYIFNLSDLPARIKDGDLDRILTKPINSLFLASLERPYFTSFVSLLSGVCLVIYAGHHLNIVWQPLNIIVGIMMMACGIVIAYSILTIATTLSFVFINATTLPGIARSFLADYQMPHTAFNGIWRLLFYFFIPVIFVASVPASIMIQGISWQFMICGITLAVVMLFVTIKFWNRMIKNYTSASS